MLEYNKRGSEQSGPHPKQIANLLGNSQHRVSEIERGTDGRKETK